MPLWVMQKQAGSVKPTEGGVQGTVSLFGLIAGSRGRLVGITEGCRPQSEGPWLQGAEPHLRRVPGSGLFPRRR